MTRISGIGTYRPAWEDGNYRVFGPDEDVITAAVAAGRAALGDSAPGGAAEVSRVVLVCAEPDYLEGAPLPVLVRGLGLDASTAAEFRVGGAPAALDAAASARPGTLVVAVSPGRGAAAAAVHVADRGMLLSEPRTVAHSLPMRVVATGSAEPSVYADSRAERELGWRPIIEGLAGEDAKPLIVGMPDKEARRFGGRGVERAPAGAAGAFFALVDVTTRPEVTEVVAVDSALGVAVTVSDADQARVEHDIRPGVPAASRPRHVGGDVVIPMSMPSYDRAFEQKLSLVASRCPQCGVEAYPRRERCLGCGRMGDGEPFALPRTGEVYSVVTVFAPVPGIATPRALAVVSLPPTSVRVLAHVADTAVNECQIGDRGRLVLRLIAVREGVPDYGYAFQPEVAS